MGKEARAELVEAIRERYRGATKESKGRVLDELVAVSGFHRKHAIRLLRKPSKVCSAERVIGKRLYDEAIRQALILVWEAADRMCGKGLKAALPGLLTAMEKHGHLQLSDVVRQRLKAVSAATMDRLLKPVRKAAGSRRKKRPGKRMSREIPVKTSHDWTGTSPGHLETDFVVHGGGNMAGEYLHRLVVTDVFSGWTEAVALLAREQNLVVEGLKRMGAQLPMPIVGIDTDNDGALINETLASHCREQKITFTRSRVQQKNDPAWIEQKNGAVIRRMVGHDRLSGRVAGQALAQLLQLIRLHVNFFQPSFKFRERVRDGAKVRKVYHAPATPCDRLLGHPGVSLEAKDALRSQEMELDPINLLHRIRLGQSALATLSTGHPVGGPIQDDLNQFLAKLPDS